MKICIVSGIFEPESGGPATYAPMLARKLTEAGHEVIVVTFSKLSSYPSDGAYPFTLVRVVRGNKFLNRIRFFMAVRTHIRASGLVYMLDWFAAGLPASIAARIAGRPYVVRVGGDYLWEQKYLESGKTPIALGEFYYAGFYRHYPALYRIIRWVLRGAAHVVFNSDVQRTIYEKHYGLEHASTINNPVPDIASMGIRRSGPSKEFVFWGRFIVMKNITTLVRAFAQANIPDYTLALIGDGPQKKAIRSLIKELGLESRVSIEPSLPQKEVLDRVKDARAFILPSWTDISPNQVYESLTIGLPALVTKENYLSIRAQLPETIDPGSVSDIAAKLEMLADDAKYAEFARDFSAINSKWNWDDVVREHVALFEKMAQV